MTMAMPKLMALLLPLLLSILSLSIQPHFAAADKNNDALSQSSTIITTSIQGRLRLPDPSQALNSTRITLNDGSKHSTYTQPDGSFVFYRVPPGVHLLDVQSREHHFSQVKIQLLEEAMDVPKCIEYIYPGAPKQAIPHPLELTAHASYEYYEPRQGFSPFSILKNPMLLMMLVSVGGMVMMPKMMEGLDPEQKEQMQKQMAMQQDPSKMLTQMIQDMTGSGEEAAPPPIEKKVSSKAGGKTARRGKRD
mmetsp:Transcript_10413/g.22638  ORF Transcript_10413/g.22638 Transcript_10413/m.22638 type:complete len:249 (-) Transcript_10413:305-1051(-)